MNIHLFERKINGKPTMRTKSTKKEADTQASDSTKQAEQLAASLRNAAREGKVDLVRLLLRCGANLNAKDEEVSALFMLIFSFHTMSD